MVMNTGFWPFDNLAVEDVYEGDHGSYQVNPLIAHGLFMAGVMDTWGQGFDLIKEECEKIEAPLPEIKATKKYVTVTIKPCAKYMELLKGNASESSNTDNEELKHSAFDTDIPLDHFVKIMEFCNEPRTRAELQEFCGYKSPSHFREKILAPLLQAGKLVLTIPNKPNSPKQRYVRGASSRT